ncbi:hypothetical protein D3C72_2230250 [compost metagenome]
MRPQVSDRGPHRLDRTEEQPATKSDHSDDREYLHQREPELYFPINPNVQQVHAIYD